MALPTLLPSFPLLPPQGQSTPISYSGRGNIISTYWTTNPPLLVYTFDFQDLPNPPTINNPLCVLPLENWFNSRHSNRIRPMRPEISRCTWHFPSDGHRTTTITTTSLLQEPTEPALSGAQKINFPPFVFLFNSHFPQILRISLPLSQYSRQQSETHSSAESLRSLRKYISSIQDDAIRPLHILAGFYSHPLTLFNPTTEATTLLLPLVLVVGGGFVLVVW